MSETEEALTILIEGMTTRRTVGQVDRERVEEWPGESLDAAGDVRLLDEMERVALANGASVERKTRSEQSIGRELNFGGMSSTSVIIEALILNWTHVVAGSVAVAGIASFVNNALGAVEKWRSLRGGRSVEITYKGKRATINQGDDAKAVLDKIEALVEP